MLLLEKLGVTHLDLLTAISHRIPQSKCHEMLVRVLHVRKIMTHTPSFYVSNSAEIFRFQLDEWDA